MYVQWETNLKDGLKVVVDANVYHDNEGWSHAEIGKIYLEKGNEVTKRIYDSISKFEFERLEQEAIDLAGEW